MIGTPDRQNAIALIEEAVPAGARRQPACAELGLTLRTLERWRQGGIVKADGRPGALRPVPGNRHSEAERTQALKVVNEPRFASLPPTQIVPRLADEGRYLASESTVHRLLRKTDQLKHRGRAKAPQTRVLPRQCAQGPNELWSWDISYLPGPVQGMSISSTWYLMCTQGRSSPTRCIRRNPANGPLTSSNRPVRASTSRPRSCCTRTTAPP